MENSAVIIINQAAVETKTSILVETETGGNRYLLYSSMDNKTRHFLKFFNCAYISLLCISTLPPHFPIAPVFFRYTPRKFHGNAIDIFYALRVALLSLSNFSTKTL